MTRKRKTKEQSSYNPPPEMEVIPEPLRPSFETLLAAIGTWLASAGRTKKATLVESYFAAGYFELADRLFAFAQAEHADRRTDVAWPYLAEAYGIKERLDGFNAPPR